MFCPPGASFAVYKLPSSPGCPAASKSSMPTAAQPTFRDKALFFLGYVYVKGACVSTALFMQHVSMGIFGGDFGFVNVASGQFVFFKQGFDFEFGCPITLRF
jgi:hypothetical protein